MNLPVNSTEQGPTRWLLCLFLASVLVTLEFAQHGALPPEPRALLPKGLPSSPGMPQADTQWTLSGQGHLPMPPATPAAHASSLLAMPANHPCVLMAFWFAGSRESGPDVQIASSCFERTSQQWQAAQIVLNRAAMGDKLGFGLRRLGNPVAWLDGQGNIHLFVVATGWGGWAASRVLQVREQHPVSRSSSAPVFGAPSILPLGWLWNLSHLVRGAPLPLQDGGMVLPAYFELGIKYPVALRFDAAGGFLGMARMSERKGILQPSVIALNERHWLALMRDNRIEGKIAVAQTGDGGQTWRDLRDLNLINPDASIFAIATGPWQFVLAHNASPKSRQALDLSESGNGIDWSRLQTLAKGDTVTSGGATLAAEFSYPAMALADGNLWVSYTDNRSRIAWQRFSPGAKNQAKRTP